MINSLRYAFMGFCLWMVCAAASAHEVRPAALKITQDEQGTFSIDFRQPVLDSRRLKLTPVLPHACEVVSPPQQSSTTTAVHENWSVENCDFDQGEIVIMGLEKTITDVFVQIDFLTGEDISALLRPETPRLDLSAPISSPAKAYVGIGLDHVYRGWDHLLFIIGLTLLVARRRIFWVATAFTIAHSLSLALTALGWITVPSRPVEILIALSIVILAVEIFNRFKRGGTQEALSRPWIMAGLIGLVHGLGFAGALADIGLPKGDELLALLLFNVGVELAQISVIIAVLLALSLIAKASLKADRQMRWLASYPLGAIGMFWVITRLWGYWV